MPPKKYMNDTQHKNSAAYYRLEYDPGECTGYIEQEENQHVTMMDGTLIDAVRDHLTLPYPFTLHLDDDEEPSFIDIYPGKTLMSKRFVEILQAAGVDNLQIFPAEIVNERTGDIYRDFFVFNVVGLASCADDAASKSYPLADVKFYDQLKIDPSRTQGLKMFRLAESRMDIIVSEDVAKHIMDADLKGIVLEPVT